jgi:arylamine N-acetyltransferase
MLNFSEPDITRYLKLLGINRRKPSYNALKEIIEAQMMKVPFENISKLFYFKKKGLTGIPGFEQFLSGIEKYHFGGTCYSNNYYLHLLLISLGYDVKLCGADMSKPDVHIANIVKINDDEYIVDTGYGAPFLEPLPRNLQTDYIITSGTNRYVLKPEDSNGCSRMELYKNDELLHGYLLKPQPRSIEEFNKIIKESFNADAAFMNEILLTGYSHDRSFIIHNLNYTEIITDSIITYTLKNREELIVVINKAFGIPENILDTVLIDQPMGHDSWN